MKKVLLGILVVIVVALVAWKLMPGDKPPDSDAAAGGDAKAVEEIKAAEGDQILVLSEANTQVNWTATKLVAGKQKNMQGGWLKELEGKISGEALVSAEGSLRQVKLDIEMASIFSESDILTKFLKDKEIGFFDMEQFPTAKFVSTSIGTELPEGVKLEGATHMIEGNFELNGITKSLQLPAKIVAGAEGFELLSEFGLNRQEFNCKMVSSPLGIILGDKDIFDNVALSVVITAKPAAAAGTDAAAGTENTDAVAAAPKNYDLSGLEKEYTQTLDATQVDFEMVLVPGDEAKGIAPFYVGKYEVTWDEFLPWVYCEDIENEAQHGILRAKKLRPSLPYDDVQRGYGSDGFPALSMSQLSAKLYVAWVSEQTGKKYRLPTEAEWLHMYALGGGSDAAMDADTADATTIYFENSFEDMIGEESTRYVGSKDPNSIGVHDVAGNVCEWVLTDGDERVARGGHFMSPVEELGVGRHVEDQAEWNKNYPNEPKSIWWFVDAKWVGIRLVCERD